MRVTTLARTVWDQLAAATRQRTPFSLAWVATGSAPRAMILRGVDAPELFLATDRRSAKCAELVRDPRIGVTVLDGDAGIQVRLRGTGDLVEDPVLRRRAWNSFGPGTRALFSAPLAPGTPIDDGTELTPDTDEATLFDRFAWLRIRVDEIDHLDLGVPGHRRHLMRRDDGWAERRVVP